MSNINDNESCGLWSSMTAPGHSRGTAVQPGTAVAQPSSRAQLWHSRSAGPSRGTAILPGTAVAQPSSRAQPWHSCPAGHSCGTMHDRRRGTFCPGERNVPRGAVWLKYCSIVSQGGASEKYFVIVVFIDFHTSLHPPPPRVKRIGHTISTS